MTIRRAALFSVSNKTHVEEFARHLANSGFVILATSGTLKHLRECGVSVESIEEYTGQKEILDGRVKTLHPKIHAGLLAKRSDPKHMQELEKEGIMPIDIAVINLYPFLDNLKGEAASDISKMIELIDVGGPTMIRASAKNHRSVLPLIDPSDYERVIPHIKPGAVIEAPDELRRELASKVFAATARYDLEISKYLSGYPDTGGFSPVDGVVLKKAQDLRYGENPHQKGAFYRNVGNQDSGWVQHQGKELSYNNLLDFDAACRVLRGLPTDAPHAAILKHLNPCGAARGESLEDALRKAKLCDPRSHFGGVLVFNREVDEVTAQNVAEDFAEIVVAPGYSKEALSVFAKRKNLRVLTLKSDEVSAREIRSVAGGVLIQEPDIGVSSVRSAEVMTKRAPTEAEYEDLDFAWRMCAHVKSNAVVIVKNGMLVGVGAGQMSRVDSTEIALSKSALHKHDLTGGVAASDAFFPFSDSVETLQKRGVVAVIAPRGSKADPDVVKKADELGISLLFTGDRHFRH